ncbi:MAG: calcium/sodium antiporter [Alteromonadaceae bacterium]|nr:calcium/sodium antiporter [Alteromonadaceae bacterium]MBL4910513.1 calcium/sodium antiporter [Alteromonadaceae bacterium]
MLEHVFILLVALMVLVWSADKFVYGASSLARNFGISPMIIGLTIVAMGSSAPEMMVAATASLQGNPDTAIGNAIGSNITNIALVLGITALVKPLQVSSSTIKQELPLILLLTLVAYWVLKDNTFTFDEGLVLIVGFFIFISSLLIRALLQRKNNNKIDDPMISEAEQDIPEKTNARSAIFWLVVGIILLVGSAHYLVDSASFIARSFGISDLVIGLTVIAVGTSLPELAASVASVIKKEDDLALGNIIGSNIFNILAVLPFAGLLAPGSIDPEAGLRDAPVMIAITLLLFALCFSRQKGFFRITRLKGALLLVCYIAYQGLLFTQH